MSLQPHKTFIDETTRLNAVYWTFRYAMRALSASRETPPKPTARERRNLIKGDRSRLLESLRVAAVLHVSSAFENALTSYFALCILYRPKSFPKTKRFRPTPDVLGDPAAYLEFRKKAMKVADGEMKAGYTTRLQKFATRFAIDTAWVDASLDRFQEIRNKVAHDQALDGADDPSFSSIEVVQTATKMTEKEWQAMLALFDKTIRQLDTIISHNIVTDKGVGLALFRVLERDPNADFGDVRRSVLDEWRLPHSHTGTGLLKTALLSMGYNVDSHGRLSHLDTDKKRPRSRT